MRLHLFLALSLFWFSCEDGNKVNNSGAEISLIVLGNVQDGGSPHIGCTKDCCKNLFENPDVNRKVVCLGLVDQINQKSFMFDATPDFPEQMKMLKNHAVYEANETPDGIFLTHAHIGHYTGLMYLGKEAMGATDVAVYGMPKMSTFLEDNGPWSQLISQKNIVLNSINDKEKISVSSLVHVTPLIVPHRDEFSETVGYKIQGPNRTALFIPDIDKWEKWNLDIIKEINEVNYAFIDATFFDAEEVNHRDISEIPHPFIVESMNLFKDFSSNEKQKIHFIHFNHTNPALNPESSQTKQILNKGYHIARVGDVFPL